MKNSETVHLRIFYDGDFELIKGKTEYVGGKMELIASIPINHVTYGSLKDAARKLVGRDKIAMVWYKKYRKTWCNGRFLLKNEDDVVEIMRSKDSGLNVYITSFVPAFKMDPKVSSPRTKRASMTHPLIQKDKVNLSKKLSPKGKPIPTTPLRRSPRNLHLTNVPSKQNKSADVINESVEVGSTHILNIQNSNSHRQKLPWRKSDRSPVVIKKQSLSRGKGVVISDSEKVIEVVGDLHKGKQVVNELEKGVRSGSEKGKAVDSKGGKAVKDKRTRKLIENTDWEANFQVSEGEESDCSEIGIEFGLGEEDLGGEDLFFESEKAASEVADRQLICWKRVDDRPVDVGEEPDSESDDLRSLSGSDEDKAEFPIFNPATDFKKKVQLCRGLKFPSRHILKKALAHHAIENRYDYYYLHNDRNRVSIYCKKKCNCKWDKVKGRIVKCTCTTKNKCTFKVHAKKMSSEESFQIKSFSDHKNNCKSNENTRKISSEYLAERYLEDWRENPNWALKVFQNHVRRDLGVNVSYGICLLARGRAKLMIYGDGSDEYGRVWDYIAVVIKYNPGSSAIVVVCEGVERPIPTFQRMYICLKACKDGYLKGCRPIIGVDGCHLKGSYPGICLVAVGMDGNNNIYPVAWAVVEMETTETWSWFVQLFVEDLEKEEGNGLTFMSDRQKGLLDALKNVAPKAEQRYCVRHIWANFKLHFPGQAYKDLFWRAARTTYKHDFNSIMDEINTINPAAHSYLAAIAPQHWSRHAFSTTCKSNMLLNNMCESFNSVLKDARDKPILTHMEWMRRYVMKRRYEKKQGLTGYEGVVMPYVDKYWKWAREQTRFCNLVQSSNDGFEIDYHGERVAVNLKDKTCTCYQWDLTGIPCHHAMRCIIYRREEPELYVDDAYSKARYMKAYAEFVSPMPGPNQWEKVDKVAPEPPTFKSMTGRPRSKKRIKEPGEGGKKAVKRVKLSRTCGNCGQLGHNKKTCKNDTVPKEKGVAVRPQSTSTWSSKVRQQVAKRKAKAEALAATTSNQGAAHGTQNDGVAHSHGSQQHVPDGPRRKLGFTN